MREDQMITQSPQAVATKDLTVRYPGTHKVRMVDLLSDDELRTITLGGKTESFTRNQTIIGRGEVSGSVYFLTEGRVVSKDISVKGQEFVVRFFAPGDFFSWLFMFRRTPSVFEYQAQTSCTVNVIDVNYFEQLVRRDSSLLLRLNSVLIERLESAYMVTSEYMTESALPRVAHLIGRLGRRYGNGCTHPVLTGFSQHDIAMLAGLSRPRTSEALAALQELGLVTVRREVLVLTNVEQLLAFQPQD